jgi:tRNA dimethylallyltransferase
MAKLILPNFKEKKPLIVICGPTASGKTDLSYLFYESIESELISADSRQIYKFLNIGTAKPPLEELIKYPYHLIDFLDPNEEFSAGSFTQLANEIIRIIYSKNKVPIIVGGTGFYISALCEGLMSSGENEIKEFFNFSEYNKVKKLNRDELFNQISVIDPITAQKYEDKNPHRLIRALEYFYKTGKRISEARSEKAIETEYIPIYFAINYKREELYEKINQRCLNMIESGFIEEVQSILDLGYARELNSLNTVGYKEIIGYLDGHFSLEFAISEMQKNTRRYAKRQLTWFRRNEKINWIDSDILPKLNIIEILKAHII